MNLNWYLNRIRSMSIREILLYRIPQHLFTKLILRLHLLIKHDYKLEIRKEFKAPKYNSKQIKELFNKYPWHFKYCFFETCVPLNKTIDWLKDYHNDVNSSQKYYTSISRQDFNKNGDVKYISELSRFHYLPFMSFQYISQRDKQDLGCIFKILKSWEDQNPYLKTINYTSGIEVGIRSLNIIYTHLILKEFDALTYEMDTIIKRLISNNFIFLKNNLSLYSSANNHLVGELMGLVVISSYFDGPNLNPNKWQHKFIELLKTKYNSEGIDDEMSTRYHLTVTDHFLNGLIFLRNSGKSIDEATMKILEKSFNYIEHVKFNGVETYFGDNDDSVLLYPFFQKDFSLPDSLIGSRQFLFEDSKTYDIDFRNYLIFGSGFYNAKTKERRMPQTTFFKESGYAFIYNHKKELKLTVDFGRMGDDRLMAHSHSDQLSFTLQLNDFMFIVDPGTYQYHSQKEKWRNYFRSIKAHNTISINDRNQAIGLNRMSWIKASKILKKGIDVQNGIQKITAQIDGFNKEGVIHTRTLTHNSNRQSILIEDLLEVIDCRTSKKVSFYLHFHPNAQINKEENTIIITSPMGNKIEVSNDLFNKAKLIKANEEIPLGWFSKSFDNIQESTSLLLEININSSTKLKTQINY